MPQRTPARSSRSSRSSRRPVVHEPPVIEEALAVLAFLAARDIDVTHGRFVLATALLLLVPDLAIAQRLLQVVEERHLVAGLDLHDAIRRAT